MTSSARFYALIPTELGMSGMVWRATGSVQRFERIFLPRREDLETLIRREYPGAVPGKAEGEEISIRKMLSGQEADFDLSLLAFECLADFHAAVLRAQIRVPRGFVTTYGRLAAAAGRPGAARAAGHAGDQSVSSGRSLPSHSARRRFAWRLRRRIGPEKGVARK